MKTNIFRNIKTVYVAALCTAFVTSCQNYEIDSQSVGTPIVSCDAQETYIIDPDFPSEVVFNINANTPWKIKVSDSGQQPASTEESREETENGGVGILPSWITELSPANSDISGLSSSVSVMFEKNNSKAERTATLIISGDGVEKPVSVLLKQLGQLDVNMYIEQTENTINSNGSNSVVMKLRSNQSWELMADEPWLHFEPSNGSATGSEFVEVKITADVNNGLERQGNFKIRTASGDMSNSDFANCTIKQAGIEFGLDVDNIDGLPDGSTLDNLPAETSSITIPVNAQDGYTWSIKEAQDNEWVKAAKTDGGLQLEIENNHTYINRSTTITIVLTPENSSTRAGEIKLEKEIEINQVKSVPIFMGKTKDDTAERDEPQGSYIEGKGYKLKGNDSFSIAFPGGYQCAKLTWEFSEISIGKVLTLYGGKDYLWGSGTDNRTNINFLGDGKWFTMGNPWWVVPTEIPALKNAEIIKTIRSLELDITKQNTSKLTIKDSDGNSIVETSKTHPGSLLHDLKYRLIFDINDGTADDYVIVKSFKAEVYE